jgi:hypothetical protein
MPEWRSRAREPLTDIGGAAVVETIDAATLSEDIRCLLRERTELRDVLINPIAGKPWEAAARAEMLAYCEGHLPDFTKSKLNVRVVVSMMFAQFCYNLVKPGHPDSTMTWTVPTGLSRVDRAKYVLGRDLRGKYPELVARH